MTTACRTSLINGDTTVVGGATQSTYTTTLEDSTEFIVEIVQPTSSCYAFGSTFVRVHDDPTVSLAISDEDTVICEGGQFTLTATAHYDEVLGDVTYTWTRNGVVVENAYGDTLVDSPVTVDNDPTNYTYTVIATLTASGCQSVVTDSSTINIMVLPNPTVEIEGDHIICGSGDSIDNVHLVANVNDSSEYVDGFTYEWRLFNRTLEGFTTNVLDTLMAPRADEEPYIFSVIVANENGCTVRSADFAVTVMNAAVATVTASEYDICEGGQVTVTAHLDNYNLSDLTYQWYAITSDTVAIADATEASYTTTLDTTTTFMVRIDQLTSGCVSYADTTVYVHADPVVTLAISDEDTVICDGGQFTLTATAIYDAVLGDAVYTWTRNGQIIPEAQFATLTESPVTVDNDTTTYTYTVIATLAASGCESVVTDSSTITVTVLPSVSLVITGDPVICGSGDNATSVQLTANINDNSDLVDGFTYQWRLFNETLPQFTTNVLDTVLAPSVDPYLFQAVVFNENGCTAFSDVYAVMVNAAPVVNVTAEEADYCVGGTTTLTAHLENYNANELTYQWQVNGTDIAGANEITYTTPNNLAEGTYTYNVIVRQLTSDCIANATFDINVHADPVIDSITVDNPVVCDGGQVTVTAHAQLEDVLGNAIYTWYRNGDLIAGVTGNTFTESPVVVDNDPTVYTYSAVVTLEASGCTSVEVAAPAVTVMPHPTVSVVADGSLTVCEGGVVNLNAVVVPEDGIYNYHWFLDNAEVWYDTNRYTVQQLPARETPYEIHVLVGSEPGCVSSSQSVYVNVVPDPIVTLVDANNAGETTVCQGGTATLTASISSAVPSINGLGTYEFTWFNNGEQVGTGNTYNVPDTLAVGDYTYTVVMSYTDSTYGCDVNTAAQGGTGIYHFTVVADPEPVIVVSVGYDTVVCEGGSTQLSVHHINGGIADANYTYQWYRDGVILAGETNPTLTTDATLPVADYSYYVEVAAEGACNGFSDTIIVPVVAAPEVAIEGAANVCFGGMVTMTATVDTTYGANVQYQWNRIEGGNQVYPIAGATESTYTTDATLAVGSYNYSVTVINPITGCTVTSGVVNASVMPDPTVEILGAEAVCEGGSVTMTAVLSDTIEGAAYNYTWFRNDVQVGSNSASYTTDAALVAGNYRYYVVVTPADSMACNATSATVFANVITLPTVEISGYNTVCEGGSVVLSANVQPTGTYNYIWSFNGQTLNTQNISTLTTSDTLTAGTYTYGVEVWNNVSGTSCSATAEFIYTVVTDPTIDSIMTSLPNNQMCVGGNVTLTAVLGSNMLNSNANVTYTWTRNGRTVNSAVGNEITENITVAGTYTYTVVASLNNNNYNTGCVSEPQSVVIEVLEQPFIGISYNGLLQVCQGGYVELTAIVEGGVDTPTLTWRRNNMRISEYDNLYTIHTDTNDRIGTYNYSVTATYPVATGCVATSDEISVSVLYQPRWLETVVTPPALCQDETVYLNASVEGGVTDANHQTGTYIQWVVSPVGDTANVTNVTGGLGGHSYDIASEAGIFMYYPTYVAPENTNCAPINTPNATLVTVYAHPTATMSLGNGSDVLCFNNADDNATIHVFFTGVAPFHFYLQDMTTMDVTEYTSYSTHFTLEVTPDRTTTYRIFQLSDRYCEGEVLDDVTVTVIVSEYELLQDSLFVCSSDATAPVVFDFSQLTINESRDTIWFQIDDYDNIGFDYEFGMLDSNSDAVIWLPTTEPGTYHFGIIIDGCEYDVTVTIGWGNEYINLVDQRWDDVVVCNNNPANNGGHRFIAYQWYRNGEIIPGATHQYYQEVGGLNGVYTLWVMDDQGNEYWSCEFTVATSAAMRVYPVPAHVNDEITIELPMTDEELQGAVLDIYDAKGAHVRHIETLHQVTRISGFQAQGTYFGRILTETNEMKTVKIIIVK